MMRSLFSGVSGLKNHQVRMDVIGNNVANVNTVGFKSGRVTFKEGFAQVLQGAGAPQGGQGGTNPMQVGLGMQIGSMDTVFTQGNLETTGVTTDLAVQGDSFFVVRKGDQSFYTRAGNFTVDSQGRLVSGTNGFAVQGRMANDQGVLASDAITDITLPVGQKAPARSTTSVTLKGNLNASAVDDPVTTNVNETQVSTSITVYDGQGREFELKVNLTRDAAANTWNWEVDPNTLPAGSTLAGTSSGSLVFDGEGRLTSPTTAPSMTLTPAAGTGSAITFSMELGGGTLNGLTQFAGATTVALQDQDGYSFGLLQSYSVDQTGTITGAFSNGTTMVLGQIALADFNNPGGLVRQGDNMYTTSANSGTPIVNFASADSASSIASGALEMSNVDLTQEFTSMIIAQRGFQANSKVISSTDEMLQEIVNLKR